MTIRAVDLLRRKRDGGALEPSEIRWMIEGLASGAVPDYQWSAFLMAVVLRGMNAEETEGLTEAMLDSGTIVDLSMIPGRKVDKHSTGGVGDKTSLILAPIAASCGVAVPMVLGPRARPHGGDPGTSWRRSPDSGSTWTSTITAASWTLAAWS